MYNRDEASLFYQKAKSGLCSHAYIVDGANGIGKLEFALECARAMLCTEKDKPCGYCSSCNKALGGDHPDIHIIGKEKTASIADVREIIRRSSLKPNDGEKQIFIVCNAGKLREDSQNALLKLFEEPPKSVAIFLLTETRASLLPTVLSRGQRIHLDGLRDSELFEILREKHRSVPMSELEVAVDIASGNLGEAEKYLSKESRTLRGKAEKLLVFAISKNSYEMSNMLTVSKMKRDQLYPLLSEFVSLVNETEKHKYGVGKARLPISEECASLVENVSKRALARMGEAATLCMFALETNANVTASASKLCIDLLNAASR